MKKVVIATIASAVVLQTQAGIIVNDTWIDGTRNDPASPVYSENGTDSDADGNIESIWLKGGGGTLAPTGAGGPLQGVGFGTGSASWYTYFTPAGSPVTLANTGDQFHLTWKFTPNGVNTGSTAQGFNLALALTPPSATRPTADASVPSAAYQGYAMQMNMAAVLGNANPFQLRKWTLAGSGALLGTSGNYTSLANGATTGNTGYTSGVLYTFDLTLTRNGANGLDIVSTMSGGSLNNTGTATVSYTDNAPGTFAFDTFDIRPSKESDSATSIDTSLFRVELIQTPEPTVTALMGLGIFGLIASRRMRR
jgi:hypothetical protein